MNGIRAFPLYLTGRAGEEGVMRPPAFDTPGRSPTLATDRSLSAPDLIYRKAARRFYPDKRLDNYAGTTLKRAGGRLRTVPGREIHGLPCLLRRRARPPAR